MYRFGFPLLQAFADPQAQPQDPLLLRLRHATYLFEPKFGRFRNASLALMTIIPLLIFSFYALGFISPHCGMYQDCFGETRLILMLIGFLATLPVDVICVVESVTHLSDMRRSGEWDLLYLTEQLERGIIESRYSIILAHVWRPLLLTLNARFAAVVCFAVSFLFARGDPSIIPVTILIFLPYVFEPRWRIHALAACGLFISSRFGHPASALLASLGLIAVFWSVQFLAVALFYWITQQGVLGILFFPVVYAAVAMAFFVGYKQIARRTLDMTILRMTYRADDLR